MIVKNKIAQLLNGKIHWIFETEENLTQVQSRFAPDIIFVDISNTDYKKVGTGILSKAWLLLL
jgi:predicted glycosyltransferase